MIQFHTGWQEKGLVHLPVPLQCCNHSTTSSASCVFGNPNILQFIIYHPPPPPPQPPKPRSNAVFWCTCFCYCCCCLGGGVVCLFACSSVVCCLFAALFVLAFVLGAGCLFVYFVFVDWGIQSDSSLNRNRTEKGKMKKKEKEKNAVSPGCGQRLITAVGC